MWWKNAVFYQIYPRSFFDSNDDGIGDLKGIFEKLDYLKWLGVDAVWISPFYPSPMKDFGYDVSNYCDVDSIFGNLSDFKLLLDKSHSLGLKLLIDFIPNHTSDQHPWFLESKSALDNPKRDWYFWRDGKTDGSPPNNWLSVFDGKSAWKFDEGTKQFYMHSFLKEQPDLNWRNPELRKAMHDAMRFWLEMGVDGFRVDVSYRSMKAKDLADNPINPNWKEGMDPATRLIEKNNKNIPDIHEFNRALRRVSDEYEDKVLIGELYLPIKETVKHYGNDDEFHMPFNFALITANWNCKEICSIIENYEESLKENDCPSWVLGNHDKMRIATKVGGPQVFNSMLLLLTLRGSPTVYYGDELGLENRPIAPELIQDPWEKNVPGLGLGRDPVRTPMLWNDSPNAGFSKAEPWLPVHENFLKLNVEHQREDPQSILNFTRSLLRIRKKEKVLRYGALKIVYNNGNVLAYERTDPSNSQDSAFLIIINFSSLPQKFSLPAGYKSSTVLVQSCEGALVATADTVQVGPDSSGVLRR